MTYVVETRGRTLEETAALFDGEQQPQDLIQLGGEAATHTMARPNATRIGFGRKDKEKAPQDFLEMRDDISVSVVGASSIALADMDHEAEGRQFIVSSPY